MKIAKYSIVALAFVSVSGTVLAADADVTPGAARAVTYTHEAGNFVVNDFTFNVSTNVGLKSEENTTAIGVLTWNTRGRNHFAGSSEGGSVAACGDATTGSGAPTGAPINAAFDVNGCDGGS